MPVGQMLIALVALVAISLAGAPHASADDGKKRRVRFATFNASLNRDAEGRLVADLSRPGNDQADAVAEIIQRVRPDILLVNEFDYDARGEAARLFERNYLGRPHRGAKAIDYRHRYVAPSNTGIPSGFDLNNDGKVGGPNDALGFGAFPGQFGMAVFSKHPIDRRAIRTFQRFRWKDMPGALLPDRASTPEPRDWYSREEIGIFRLSSKSHWDLPIRIGGETVHFLTSHPTPPVFDGPEDRNGRRNHDEIRLFADYITPGRAGQWLFDESRKILSSSREYQSRGSGVDARSGSRAPGMSFQRNL